MWKAGEGTYQGEGAAIKNLWDRIYLICSQASKEAGKAEQKSDHCEVMGHGKEYRFILRVRVMSDKNWFTFLNDHHACCVENRLEMAKSGSREIN